MENSKELVKKIMSRFGKDVAEYVVLGMEIAEIKQAYYYDSLIKFLNGDDSKNGSMYFAKLKPLYDRYGYEKVNIVLLNLEEEKEQSHE